MRRNNHIATHLTLLIVSGLMLLPFYWVLKTSITGENIFQYPPALIPTDPHPYNFVEAWYFVPILRFMFNSVVVVTMTIIGNVIINALAGYALTKQFPGRRWIILLLLSAMMIPFHATIIPAFLVTSKLGLLNTHLGIALPALSHIVLVFIFKASFESIPRSLLEAARLDGLSEWRIMLNVLLPLSLPALGTNVVLTFIWSWNDFLWPLLVVYDTEMSTLPLGLTAFLSIFEGSTGALYAFAIIVLAPSVLIFLAAQRHFVRGLTAGATKG